MSGWPTSCDVYENDVRLEGRQLVAVMASLPSDRSFASYDEALAHVLGPRLPDSTEIVWQQTMLDMLFEYPIQSDRSQFSIDPTLARLGFRTQTVLRFVLPDGTVRAFDYRGNPGLVRLDPRLEPGGAPVRRSSASSTSWTAPTTCSFSPASSSRSAASGRSSPSSRRSRSRIR